MRGKNAELWLNEGAPFSSTDDFVPSLSPAMQALEQAVTEIGPTEVPVLVSGERGSGKGMLALQLHRNSRREGTPFVSLPTQSLATSAGNGNASRMAEWVSHFFTGATVFVDEIGNLQPEGQAAMADVLSGAYGRVTARLVCSSRIHLMDEVRLGRFREDLYYRISGVSLRIPPLRHRKEDIPVLAKFFLAKYAALFGRTVIRPDRETLEALMRCVWPGNVRELENTLKSAVAVRDGSFAVTAFGLGRELSHSEAKPLSTSLREPLSTSLKEAARAASLQAERELILKVLGRTRWNRKRAAQELQISYKALLYKLKQTGLDNRELSQTNNGGNDS